MDSKPSHLLFCRRYQSHLKENLDTCTRKRVADGGTEGVRQAFHLEIGYHYSTGGDGGASLARIRYETTSSLSI